MQGIISFANSSVSSLYGCIGYTVQDMLLHQFPKNYFRSTTMASELATRNMRRLVGLNTNNELQKRQKPSLFIQPTYADTDRSEPMQGIPLTCNFDNLQYSTNKQYLFEVIRDREYGYSLKFRMNRDRIDYDITITLDTLHQQLDIYKMMKNQLRWERPFSAQIALESIIPKNLIGQISKLCHMDLEAHAEFVPILLRRLNTVSGYPITYKIRNASATDEWFMYYVHNVIFTYSDLQVESGTRKGMSEDRFPITFRVSAEFNLPGVYFLEGNQEIIETIDLSLKTKEYNEDNSVYLPIFTVSNLYAKFPPEQDGMLLYGTSLFKTDVNPNGDPRHPQYEDRIDLKGVLDDEHIRVLRTHRNWNMQPETLMRTYVLKNGTSLVYDQDFKIDWNTLELVVYSPDPEATYRIALYFNYATVNEILTHTEYENVYDTAKLPENKFPEHGLEDGSFIRVDGTPTFQEAPDIKAQGPTIPEPMTIARPDLVLQKDKVLMDVGDSVLQDTGMVPAGYEEGTSDETVSVPGDYENRTFNRDEDPGIPVEMIHPATLPPSPVLPPFEPRPLDEMSPSEIFNTQVVKPPVAPKAQKQDLTTLEKPHKKKFSSSTK